MGHYVMNLNMGFQLIKPEADGRGYVCVCVLPSPISTHPDCVELECIG